MTIEYSVSNIADCFDEVFGLLAGHYEELSVTKQYELKPDFAVYREYDKRRAAKVILCKCDGAIIGYIVFFVTPHLHYLDCLLAVEDIYYLKPEYRKGRIGLKMFKFAESYLESIGVNMVKYSTKVHSDNSALFEYLGCHLTEKVFLKSLGAK